MKGGGWPSWAFDTYQWTASDRKKSIRITYTSVLSTACLKLDLLRKVTRTIRLVVPRAELELVVPSQLMNGFDRKRSIRITCYEGFPFVFPVLFYNLS